MSVPIGGRTVGGGSRVFLLRVAFVSGVIATHAVLVDCVDSPGFACLYQKALAAAGSAGQQQSPAGTLIYISVIQSSLVKRREGVADGFAGRGHGGNAIG